MEKSLEAIKYSRSTVEEPEANVASKRVNLNSQTSCCYKIMNHFYTALDLRQCLPGKFTEVLFNKTVQLIIRKIQRFLVRLRKTIHLSPLALTL